MLAKAMLEDSFLVDLFSITSCFGKLSGSDMFGSWVCIYKYCTISLL